MKNVICILAILCTVNASKQDLPDPTDILEKLVNKQKEATEIVLNDLTTFDDQIHENLELKLNSLKTDGSLKVNDIIYSTLNEVRKTVEEAKERGKDVDNCYKSAERKLNACSENANVALQTCVENSKMIVEAPFENVAKTVEALNMLITDLDAIIPNCYDSNFIKMQACVTKALVVSRISHKNLEKNAKEVKRTANAAFVRAISSTRTCVMKSVADVRTTSTDIIVATNSCVRTIE